MSLATATLLLLGDGRFPAGGHVHSAGIEAAMGDGRVGDVGDVREFVVGRLWTTGRTDAALTVATLRELRRHTGAATVLRRFDAEADARLPVPTLRAASRRLGRQLLRVAAPCWPDGVLTTAVTVADDGLHHSVALGAVGAAAGLDERDVATLSLHHAVSTPMQGALRLAGLDPFALARCSAELASTVAELTELALVDADAAPADLPCAAPVLTEIAAIHHAENPARLFAT